MCLALFLLLLFAAGYKGLHVQGPSVPLVVQLGDTVVLPCFAQSPLPLEGLQVEWRKTHSESLVNIFQQGESRPELQSPSFRGRAHFFPDAVSKGNFSILLQNVGKEDAGIYRCRVNTFQESSQALIEIEDERLVVTGALGPVITSVGEDVVLNCSVESHLPVHIEQVSWRRTDRNVLVLLFQDNKTLPESSHESYHGRAEFFTTEIPKGNFSLKLKNVKMEDKGEFTCDVHTSDKSGHTVVVLQRLGFSLSNLLVLGLCFASLLLAVGLCVPVCIYFRKKVYTKMAMKVHTCLIFCPNICMCAAFILLSNEVSTTEYVTCSVFFIIRPLMLMKTSPYINTFPKLMAKALKYLALPLHHSIIAMTACSKHCVNIKSKFNPQKLPSSHVSDQEPSIVFSNLRQAKTASEHIGTVMIGLTVVSFISALILAWYALRLHSAMVLVICNGALLGLFLNQSKADFDYSIRVPAVLAPLIVGIMLLSSIQRHFFQGKPFRCHHIAVTSAIITGFSLIEIIVFVLIGIALKNFTRAWILLFEAIMYIITWISVIFLLRCCRRSCCLHQRWKGYLPCATVVAVLIIAYGAACLHFVNLHMENSKDRGGYMALTVLIHFLAAAAFFKHSEHLPDFPHKVVYMFGTVGLTIVNAVTLATELNLRVGKGSQSVEDLRVLVLPFETVFVFAWLALQIYSVFIINRDRLKHNSEDQKDLRPQVLCEMEVLTASVPKPPDSTEESGYPSADGKEILYENN